MRLMANLPLPAPLTEHVRFVSWKEHTAASVLTCKHLNAALCQRKRLYVCVYAKRTSVKAGMSWVRSYFCFLSLYLWPQSSGLTNKSSPPFEAVQVRSCLLLSSEVFICRAPHCHRRENRSYVLNSTDNKTLMAGRRAKASIFSP